LVVDGLTVKRLELLSELVIPRGAWACSSLFSIPHPRYYGANDCLAAGMGMDMLDGDLLLSLTAVAL